MPKLPRARGDRHIAVFKRAGGIVNPIEGSHHILVKEGSPVHLSIPVHSDQTLGPGLLRKLIKKSGDDTRGVPELLLQKELTGKEIPGTRSGCTVLSRGYW